MDTLNKIEEVLEKFNKDTGMNMKMDDIVNQFIALATILRETHSDDNGGFHILATSSDDDGADPIHILVSTPDEDEIKQMKANV